MPRAARKLSKARIEISKALIPDEYLQVSEIEQFRPPSTHPLHEGEAFQIAMLCRTRTPVDLKALQGALPPAPCTGDLTADGQYLRLLYGEKDPIAAWVSLRGRDFIASSASAKSLASFRSMDDHLQTILEAIGKQNKKLTLEQRVKLLCFGTTYFATQPKSYMRMIFGEREGLAHFVARGTLYIPPDMKVLDARATSLFRGWDGGIRVHPRQPDPRPEDREGGGLPQPDLGPHEGHPPVRGPRPTCRGTSPALSRASGCLKSSARQARSH